MSWRDWIPSWQKIVGSFVMLVGAAPGVLWVLNYADLIRPGEEPGASVELIMSAGLLGLGWMIASERGTRVWEAFLQMFPGRGRGSGQ